jgi:hypothetical protein
VQEARLEASDAWGSFGYHLDFSANGNVLAVGAYESAYVFTRSAGTWMRQARLESGAGGGEYFGIVVGLSATGTTLAVGAHLADFDRTGNAGKVYVFTYAEGRWVRQAELHAGDVTEQSHFGVLALSPDGDTLAVGAYSADYTRQRAGKVFIFQRSDGVWTQRAILQPKEAAPGDCFGINLAMSADAKVLGVAAYCATTAGVSGAGAVYVFSRTGDVWTEEVRLESAAPAVQANAGVRISLSADGNTLAVGEYHANNSGGPRAGNAYVFTRAYGAWTRQSLLQASDASPDASFGCSVSLSGDGNTLIVGAYGSDHEAGRAYVFTRTRNSWFERAQLRADDTVAGDNFGIRVAMTPDGATLGIGAYLANNRAGKVYTFARERLKN